jgi:hypothetical protein
MRILAGLSLGGASLTDSDDLPDGRGEIGRAILGPSGLLGDHRRRLGVVASQTPCALRVARWSARLAAVTEAPAFWTTAFAVDPWGVASDLLRWRDELVEAGWDGRRFPNAGARLDALAAAAEICTPELPAGQADLLARVELAMRARIRPLYQRVDLVEPPECWPFLWRRIFEHHGRLGSVVAVIEPELPGAPSDTDLGRLQSHLRNGGAPATPKGDGTLLLLRAETPIECASATAALLRASSADDTVCVRGVEPLILDQALARQGLPALGVSSSKALRPALQVLPLVLDLAFEPKDPCRLLELLTLPVGPLQGRVGRELAGALVERPGIGNDTWKRARASAIELVEKQATKRALEQGIGAADAAKQANARAGELRRRIETWIERPGYAQVPGAPRAALMDLAADVATWARRRAAVESDEPVFSVAAARAEVLVSVLAEDPRAKLTPIQLGQLVQSVSGGGMGVDLTGEVAGRLDHLDAPAALLRPRATVVWWGFVEASAGSIHRAPWRAAEIAALHAAGIHPVDPVVEARADALSWRRVVLAATRRLVLVAPCSQGGAPTALHPLWDELFARMGGSDQVLAALTLADRDLLRQAKVAGGSVALPGVRSPAPLDPPRMRDKWLVRKGLLAARDRHSASSLEALLGCPLRFVLTYHARLDEGGVIGLPAEHLLYGSLGHELARRLFQDADNLPPRRELADRAGELFDALVAEEAAQLLQGGMKRERAQLRAQIVRSMVGLGQLLRGGRLRVVAIEQECSARWREREIGGRLDLLLADSGGRDVVLDLKWGRTRYRIKLEEGFALQLAVYAFLRKAAKRAKAFPPAGYFSLREAALLAIEPEAFGESQPVYGPTLEETWKRAERTIPEVEKMLLSGTVPANGPNAPVELAEVLGIPGDRPGKHLLFRPGMACEYCVHDGVCGARWEGWS